MLKSLVDMADMADSATVYVLVASRLLTEDEQHSLVAIVNRWAREWMSVPAPCSASTAEILLGGWAVAWAAQELTSDLTARDLTGADFDPLFRAVDHFGSQQVPPLVFGFGEGFLVNDEVLPMIEGSKERLRELLLAGQITTDTLLFHAAPVGVWRAGQFVHRLGDDADWLAALRKYMRS
jgi:hypothetical protein